MAERPGRLSRSETAGDVVAILGPGRIGRPIAVTFALGGSRVLLIELKDRAGPERRARIADARREMERDLRLMAEEEVIKAAEIAPALDRIEDRTDLDGLVAASFVQEALPERRELKREVLGRLAGRVAPDTVIASTSSTISPSHLADAVEHPERFLVAHWLNPAHVVPLVEVVPGPRTTETVIASTIDRLERLGKVPVRCADSPGFIGPRMQVLLMNEAVRLVAEGVARPEDVDRAFRAGMGFRYAAIGLFEFIDWGGVDVLYHASRYLTEALADERFRPAPLVAEKIARDELGPKTGRGFFDYPGETRDRFETEKLRALLRQLRRQRAP